jgi:hypothetical protein
VYSVILAEGGLPAEDIMRLALWIVLHILSERNSIDKVEASELL